MNRKGIDIEQLLPWFDKTCIVIARREGILSPTEQCALIFEWYGTLK